MYLGILIYTYRNYIIQPLVLEIYKLLVVNFLGVKTLSLNSSNTNNVYHRTLATSSASHRICI